MKSTNEVAVVCFGRCNPPSCGHLHLFKMMSDTAEKINGDALIFLSHSNDPQKNPLDFNYKAIFIQQVLDEEHINAEVQIDSNAATMFHVMNELWKMKYKEVLFVMGEDRIEENIIGQLQKYNGHGDPVTTRLFYIFDDISVINAGGRDDNSDDILQKASASLLRKFVKENDFENFYKFCITTSREDAQELFNKTKEGMKL